MTPKQLDIVQQAADALRDAEDRLVNTLPQVSQHRMDLWNEARNLVASNPDWNTYRMPKDDPDNGIRGALIQQFKAIESVRNALQSLFDAGLAEDKVSKALVELFEMLGKQKQ